MIAQGRQVRRTINRASDLRAGVVEILLAVVRGIDLESFRRRAENMMDDLDETDEDEEESSGVSSVGAARLPVVSASIPRESISQRFSLVKRFQASRGQKWYKR